MTDATMVARSVHSSQQLDSQPDWDTVGEYSFLRQRWEHPAVWDDEEDDSGKEQLQLTSRSSDGSPLRRSGAQSCGWHATAAASATAKGLQSFLKAFELSPEQGTLTEPKPAAAALDEAFEQSPREST